VTPSFAGSSNAFLRSSPRQVPTQGAVAADDAVAGNGQGRIGFGAARPEATARTSGVRQHGGRQLGITHLAPAGIRVSFLPDRRRRACRPDPRRVAGTARRLAASILGQPALPARDSGRGELGCGMALAQLLRSVGPG